MFKKKGILKAHKDLDKSSNETVWLLLFIHDKIIDMINYILKMFRR
jgi:hypothetical protein